MCTARAAHARTHAPPALGEVKLAHGQLQKNAIICTRRESMRRRDTGRCASLPSTTCARQDAKVRSCARLRCCIRPQDPRPYTPVQECRPHQQHKAWRALFVCGLPDDPTHNIACKCRQFTESIEIPLGARCMAKIEVSTQDRKQ